MEREDIENSLKVLSHIVDDDFIITVDEARKIIRIDGETIEALQEEVKRLKDSNDELRERQTYIDRYGTEWLTSAKDVPNYAYEHGYADGMAEVKAQLPKRRKWLIHSTGGSMATKKCPFCGSESWQSKEYAKVPKYCQDCGAHLPTFNIVDWVDYLYAKTEVQG